MFYVGKGKGHRVYDKTYRNMHWKNIVDHDGGFNVCILKKELTNTEACILESEEISKIGLNNLTNVFPGDITLHMTDDEFGEWKKNHRKSLKGMPHPWAKGKKRPDHSKFMMGRKNPKLGEISSMPKSKETKEKMKLYWTGRVWEKIKCDKCNKLRSKNNFKSHTIGKKCKPLSSKFDRVGCEYCGKLVSKIGGNMKQHQNGKKCLKRRISISVI